jgi:S-formylglutathione hydrolase FrmB
MRAARGLVCLLLLGLTTLEGDAAPLGVLCNFKRINRRLSGQVIDFTNNHGADRRIWSAALGERRDLYVYLPPGFDPCRQYPLAIYLHGSNQDEQFFLKNQVELFDRAIACGDFPPIILAAPDGSIQGRPSFYQSASFFANSSAGNFEDLVVHDVWDFMVRSFPIRPERHAHALVGASMGGSAAFALAIKHRDRFGIAVGFAPALNLRWVDCRDRYKGDFDPDCWAWRTRVGPLETVGRAVFVPIRFRVLLGPVLGRDFGPEGVSRLSTINPIEMLDSYDVRDGDLAMYVAYGGRDEFNIDAQVESFLYRAAQRGLSVGVGYDPKGKHDLATGVRLFPGVLRWAAPLVAPYSPGKVRCSPNSTPHLFEPIPTLSRTRLAS